MENNELLNMLSQLFDEKLEPIKQDMKELKQDVSQLKEDVTQLKQGQFDTRKDISEIKDMFMNLEGVNGKRHFEILGEVKDLKENFDRVEKEVNKVEVVTGKNCIEIEYLKAVK